MFAAAHRLRRVGLAFDFGSPLQVFSPQQPCKMRVVSSALLSVCLLSSRVFADLRSTVYAATIARSGSASNCTAVSSLFTPDGSYESPVGSGSVTGAVAIAAACENWNALIDHASGNGWCACTEDIVHLLPTINTYNPPLARLQILALFSAPQMKLRSRYRSALSAKVAAKST